MKKKSAKYYALVLTLVLALTPTGVFAHSFDSLDPIPDYLAWELDKIVPIEAETEEDLLIKRVESNLLDFGKLNKSLYTEDSFVNLENAYNALLSLFNNYNSLGENRMMNLQNQNIEYENALVGLVVANRAETESLKETLARFDNLDAFQYKDYGYEDVMIMANEARFLLNDDASKEKLVDINDRLTLALDNMVSLVEKITSLQAELKELIVKAEAVDQSNYHEDGVAVMTELLTNAKIASEVHIEADQVKDLEILRDNFENSIKNLKTITLEERYDMEASSRLNETIENAKSYLESNLDQISQADISKLTDMINEGLLLLDKYAPVEKDDFIVALESKVAEVKAKPNTDAQKTTLNNLMVKAEQIVNSQKLGHFTRETYDEFLEVYNVYKNFDQNTTDHAYLSKAIENMTSALEKLEVMERVPEFDIKWRADVNQINPGDRIRFEVLITNTGNVPLENVKLNVLALGFSENIGTLDVGKSKLYRVNYPVGESLAGSVLVAKAEVQGTDLGELTKAEATLTIPVGTRENPYQVNRYQGALIDKDDKPEVRDAYGTATNYQPQTNANKPIELERIDNTQEIGGKVAKLPATGEMSNAPIHIMSIAALVIAFALKRKGA